MFYLIFRHNYLTMVRCFMQMSSCYFFIPFVCSIFTYFCLFLAVQIIFRAHVYGAFLIVTSHTSEPRGIVTNRAKLWPVTSLVARTLLSTPTTHIVRSSHSHCARANKSHSDSDSGDVDVGVGNRYCSTIALCPIRTADADGTKLFCRVGVGGIGGGYQGLGRPKKISSQ